MLFSCYCNVQPKYNSQQHLNLIEVGSSNMFFSSNSLSAVFTLMLVHQIAGYSRSPVFQPALQNKRWVEWKREGCLLCALFVYTEHRYQDILSLLLSHQIPLWHDCVTMWELITPMLEEVILIGFIIVTCFSLWVFGSMFLCREKQHQTQSSVVRDNLITPTSSQSWMRKSALLSSRTKCML